jgi:hypothetical protein
MREERMAVDLQELKAKQDEYNARRDKLLARVADFRTGFLERLTQFAEEAESIGLADVTKPEVTDRSLDIFERTMTIAKWEITFAASDSVYPLTFGSPELASKLCGYLWATVDTSPFMAYTFTHKGLGTYACRFDFLGPERPVLQRSWPTIDAKVGREGAEELIRLVYGLLKEWKERPSLGDILYGDEAERTPLGYPLPKSE